MFTMVHEGLERDVVSWFTSSLVWIIVLFLHI